uniref:Reverse transcriptase domain-containing protein n=1 Tax=Tanacetum cinerariifolium TaxID=118510 RepID=A0A699HIE7_TANCI|nr:reverse transcriptase domain-containing protein [Tanacetum cinerariifolium]
MSTHSGLSPTPPTSAVRNTVGKRKEISQENLNGPAFDSALREYRDKHYNQLLLILAEKMHPKKVQQEKVKAVKARLKFKEVSQYSESRTPSRRRDNKKRLGSKYVRSVPGSLEPRRGRSESPRKRGPERKTMFKRLEKSVFHGLGDKEKEYASKKNSNKRESLRRTKTLSEVEDSAKGYWKSRSKRQKSSIEENDLSRPWAKAAKGGNLKKGQAVGNTDGTAMAEGSQIKDYPNLLSPETVISFPPLKEEDGTKGPMIIEAETGGHFVHYMYVDGGSFSKIMYEHCFNRFHSEVTIPIQRNHRKARSKENTGSPVYSSRNAKIPSDRQNGHITEQQNYFTIAHNGLKTRSATAHNRPSHRRKDSDMTGVPRHIVEHRLNIYKGCLPVRQNKMGQASERNKAIYEEVEMLVNAGIRKEVHYHSWLSNPVMVKKHDGSWRICVDFKDLNKACPGDGYPLSEIDWKTLYRKRCGLSRRDLATKDIVAAGASVILGYCWPYFKHSNSFSSNLSSEMASVLVNGSPTAKFQFYCRLKQGDPLALYLFILVMKSLHLSFYRVVDAGIFKGIKIDNSTMISYLFYADDVVFVGVGIPNDLIVVAASTLGCSIMKTPFKYLGVMVGGIRRNFFNGAQDNDKKITWVKWAKVLSEKTIHGLNIQKLSSFTFSIWNNILKEVNILKDRGVDLISHCKRRVGNGMHTRFWSDVWLGDQQLRYMFPRIYALEENKECSVAVKLQRDVEFSLRRQVRGGVEAQQLVQLQDLIGSSVLVNAEDRWF